MLSEDDIQRYARHILLPEVGGVGQEKLCAAEVRVSGERIFVELAGDYLSAAGVKVDAHSGPGLKLLWEPPPGGDSASLSLHVEDGAVVCISNGAPSGPLPLEDGSIAACLAATELLRAILELGAPRGWRVRAGHVERLP